MPCFFQIKMQRALETRCLSHKLLMRILLWSDKSLVNIRELGVNLSRLSNSRNQNVLKLRHPVSSPGLC